MEVHFCVDTLDGNVTIKRTKEKAQKESVDAEQQAREITEGQIYGTIRAEKEKVTEAEALKAEFEMLRSQALSGDQKSQYLVAAAQLWGVENRGMSVVVENLEEALYWFSQLLAKGYPKALEKQQECIKQMNDRYAQKIWEAEKKAREEKEKQERKKRLAIRAAQNEFEALVQFAETENPEGMYYLAESYFNGVTVEDTVIVEPDLKMAIKYFTNSLRGGHREAFGRLAECQALKAEQDKEKKKRTKKEV